MEDQRQNFGCIERPKDIANKLFLVTEAEKNKVLNSLYTFR